MCIIIIMMMIIIINQFKRPSTRVLHPVESSASSIATTPRTVEAKPCIGVLVTEACVFFVFVFSLVAVFLLYEFSSFFLRFCANGIDVSSWEWKPLCRRGACGDDRHLCVVGVGGVHWLEGCE